MVTKNGNKKQTRNSVWHTEFRDKKKQKNIDMVTEMVTLFIYMFDEDLLYATLFYTQLFFIRILKSYISNVNFFIIFFS